jgi:hypothetical protein
LSLVRLYGKCESLAKEKNRVGREGHVTKPIGKCESLAKEKNRVGREGHVTKPIRVGILSKEYTSRVTWKLPSICSSSAHTQRTVSRMIAA